MYVLVKIFILDSGLANHLRKKLSFWLSACSVLTVVPLLLVHPVFPLVSWMEGVGFVCLC